MTPESIAGLSIPEKQLKELIDALAATQAPIDHEDFELPLAA